MEIDFSYQILSSTTYSMTVSVGYNMTITNMWFSKVIYNTADFSMISHYYINTYDWTISNATASGYMFNVPSTITNNQFIVGLKSFSCSTGQAVLVFSWTAGTYSGMHGI
jgi:hypothetical protein